MQFLAKLDPSHVWRWFEMWFQVNIQVSSESLSTQQTTTKSNPDWGETRQSLWAESMLSWAVFCLVHKRNSAPGFSSPSLCFRIGTLCCFRQQTAVSTVCLRDLLWETSLIVWAKPGRHGGRGEHKGNNWRHGQDRDRNKAGDGPDTHLSPTNWNTFKCLAAAAC